MFKKILITTALIAVIGALVFGAVDRTQAKTGSESVYTGQDSYGSGSEVLSVEQAGEITAQAYAGNGYGQGIGNGTASSDPTANGAAGNGTAGQLAYLAAPGELSAEEAAALLYMREEEKLAHDVYITLYAQWGLPLFQNISQSEQSHTDVVKALLDRYGLSDPASGAVGVFTNPELQALYTTLVAQGGQSLAEALKAGAAIEEIDILDLQERLAQTDNADIQQVFNNLLNGSNNHLRAFVSALSTQAGETYQPQYLSVEAYQAIINSASGSGGYGNGAGAGAGQGGAGQGGSGGGGRGGRP